MSDSCHKVTRDVLKTKEWIKREEIFLQVFKVFNQQIIAKIIRNVNYWSIIS